ncbi:low temperature requirement protein A [Kitasatospora sp. NPDC049285]|uniref:low temperature requirement protein A n=1 Tax=Kitasatospora sp. NPDC049285 TaxID=3157096 RepID=UPI003422FF49
MEEKRVTWAELYFDLVFVFAVTQVSGLLHHHHDWAGVGRALVAFVPVYWCWVGTTVQANIRDVDNARDRIGIFAVGLAGLFMALALPGAFGPRGVLFGAAYWAARLVLLGLMARQVRRIWIGPYGVAGFLTGPLLLLGGLAGSPLRETLWALAAATDLAAPLAFRRHLARVDYHPGHLPERFGLFLLVALGESIVGIGAPVAGAPLHAGQLASVAVAFVISCALWWQYFGYAADAMRYALETAVSRRDVMRQVFSYGHLALIAGVITVAVGFAETVARPGGVLGDGALGLLYGGSVLYLLSFSYTRKMMFGMISPTRLAAAAVVSALLAVLLLTPLHRLPALAVLVLLAVVLVGLNGWEALRVRRARQAVGASE